MAVCYVPNAMLYALLAEPGNLPTFAPLATRRLSWLDQAGPACNEMLSAPRAAQSPKGLLLPPVESAGRYGAQGAATAVEAKCRVVAGVRACELRAWRYLDAVLRSGEFEDPAYRARRDATVIVSCDCVDCADSCFCTLVGGEPFCRDGYDVNLTALGEGFLVDIATERGRQWIGDTEDLQQASSERLAERDRIREAMVERVRKQNEAFAFRASDQSQPALPNDGDEAWQTFAADCVECGACTNICPTCYCFYLYDQVLGPEEFERVRTWDSCLLSTYHRMAGGEDSKLSPRPSLYSRLANRVLHKFAYSPQQTGHLGCVGCGRCVDACIGQIDIRRVVQELGT